MSPFQFDLRYFHKPVARFIGDMIYGIMVEKDVKLSSVVRALKEKTTPKKVEDRLSRMLSSDGLEAGLHGVIASEGARRVRKDTLIILDPSDAQKPYAKKMEYLAKVWDGTSDILKRGRRWRGFDPEEAGKRAEETLFAFFGMNTG